MCHQKGTACVNLYFFVALFIFKQNRKQLFDPSEWTQADWEWISIRDSRGFFVFVFIIIIIISTNVLFSTIDRFIVYIKR